MAEAHKQDFEKKRPPPEGPKVGGEGEDGEGELRSDEEEEEYEDDEDDDESGSLQEERMQAREAETLIKRVRGERDGDDDAWV